MAGRFCLGRREILEILVILEFLEILVVLETLFGVLGLSLGFCFHGSWPWLEQPAEGAAAFVDEVVDEPTAVGEGETERAEVGGGAQRLVGTAATLFGFEEYLGTVGRDVAYGYGARRQHQTLAVALSPKIWRVHG